MKKSVITSLSKIVLSIYFLSMLFYSCSENNPVVQRPVDSLFIDSNFFDWEYHEIAGTNADFIYVADTNTVFISGFPKGVLFDNGVNRDVLFNDADFWSGKVFGVGKELVLFTGTASYNNGYKTKLKKWNGAGLTDVITPDYPSGRVKDIYFENLNEFWMLTDEGYIYHNINNSYITYKVDSTYHPYFLNKSNSGEYRVFAIKFLGNNDDDRVLKVYLFQNDSWVKEYSDTIRINSELQGLGTQTENVVVRYGKTGLYKYLAGNWVKYFDYYDFYPYQNDGKSLSEFMICDESTPQRFHNIYFSVNKHLYKQTEHHIPEGSASILQIVYKFGNYYVMYFPEYLFLNNFSIATPKYK